MSCRCSQFGWRLLAMQDPARRRGVWIRVDDEDRPRMVEVCYGREGDDGYFAVTRRQASFRYMFDLYLFAVWIDDLRCTSEQLPTQYVSFSVRRIEYWYDEYAAVPGLCLRFVCEDGEALNGFGGHPCEDWEGVLYAIEGGAASFCEEVPEEACSMLTWRTEHNDVTGKVHCVWEAPVIQPDTRRA